MSEHTKGPWFWDDEDVPTVYHESFYQDKAPWLCGGPNGFGVVIGQLAVPNPADKSLIAAAPELLEACKKALTRHCGCHRANDEHWHSDTCPVPTVRAAIAKAEGKEGK